MRIVAFAGGRGGASVIDHLVRDPAITLTVVCNGYDDGLSTGVVRRLMNDMLGPSDFRKNASRIATTLGKQKDTPAFLEGRLVSGSVPQPSYMVNPEIVDRLHRFEYFVAGHPFEYVNASLGNLVFVGCYLRAERNFNAALDDYCALLDLPVGLIENVSCGENASLVGIDDLGEVLGSEAEIVSARCGVRDLFLVPFGQRRPLPPHWAIQPTINPRVAAAIAEADVILYTAGTQHSSLCPSYMTVGVAEAISENARAIKVLLANLAPDADIGGYTVSMLVTNAYYYLCRKGWAGHSSTSLITHCYMDNGGGIPLGDWHSMGPLTLRGSRFGAGGRHDGARVVACLWEDLARR